MPDIFKGTDDTERLPILFHGIDYNGRTAPAAIWRELPEGYGVWADHVVYSTPITFQSEAHPEIEKGGGGIEYYNPRVASRVLNIRSTLLAPTRGLIGAIVQEIQDDFSPLEFAWEHSGGWPNPAGRPQWTDPWSTNHEPLEFSRMNDGSIIDGLKTDFPSGEVLLEHNVALLELPDPPVHSVTSGFSADINLTFLILDGGASFGRTDKTLSGNGDITQTWGDAVSFPKITFSMDGGGAGASNLTLATTGVTGYSPANLVLDVSGLSGTEDVKIIVRDRKIYVDDVETPGLYVSGDYPIVPPRSDTATYTWTNTTNTESRVITYREALAN